MSGQFREAVAAAGKPPPEAIEAGLVAALELPANPCKRFATGQARAALKGITLHELAGDDGRPEYVATQHAMTRAFHDLTEFESWMDRIEGKRP